MSERDDTEESPAAEGESVHGALRLRSAGVGVVVGGAWLLVTAPVLTFLTATGALVVLAVVLALAGRRKGTWWLQLCVGIGAVGVIGLVEATTEFGLELGALELGAIAVVFGLFDVAAGTLIHRLRPTGNAE